MIKSLTSTETLLLFENNDYYQNSNERGLSIVEDELCVLKFYTYLLTNNRYVPRCSGMYRDIRERVSPGKSEFYLLYITYHRIRWWIIVCLYVQQLGNTGPWLADNQSRELNNEFWLVEYLCVQQARLVQLQCWLGTQRLLLPVSNITRNIWGGEPIPISPKYCAFITSLRMMSVFPVK